jgi:hypothetical protein
MSKTNRNPIDPLSIDAAEIMKYIQKQYFKFFETPPYETLGYTVLYNRILPAGARVVQRLGCMVGELPRLEGFMEPGLHGAIAGSGYSYPTQRHRIVFLDLPVSFF